MPAIRSFLLPLIIGASALLAQDESSSGAEVQDYPVPPVTEIVRINGANAFFLDKDGQIGVARFTDELELEAWDYYSNFQWAEARHLAVGRKLSVVSGTPNELTQAFDTDKDGLLDFFQDTISDWPGKSEGATISCGPVADNYGRLLFAVAPKPRAGEDEEKPGKVPPSTLFAWNPGGQKLTILATSSLPIAEMTVSPTGVLAAWIQLPSYTEGYYVALQKLPEFNPKKPDEQPANPPKLRPNLIIPGDLTEFQPIGQLGFATENGVDKLFITCPLAKRLIELIPEEHDGIWGGAITVRATYEKAVHAVEMMAEDKVLLGGDDGFFRLSGNLDKFRYTELRIAPDAVEIDFSQPVDRAKATSESGGILMSLIPLEGELDEFDPPEPVVESDGKTIVLKLPELPGRVIIKIEAPELTSEDGEPLISPSFYYTLNRVNQE